MNSTTLESAAVPHAANGRPASAPAPRATQARPRAGGVSLVIPARNEARNISWVLEQIPDCVDEVLLVDGASRDATLLMASRCLPRVRAIPQEGPGKGSALRTGFRRASGERIVMMDADGSMSPQEIPRYLHFLDNGFDFVKGSRFVAGGGSLDITALRRAGNLALLAAVRGLYHTTITDLCYGFCAFHRCFLDHLDLRSDGFEIETEMVLHALRAGLRIAEVPSLELPRRSGRSNLRTFRDGARVLRVVLGERRTTGPASVAGRRDPEAR
jgi:glycosyltransferase involved in cell wall biosynthesis